METTTSILFRLSLGQKMEIRKDRKDVPLELQDLMGMTLAELDSYLENAVVIVRKEPEMLDLRMYGAQVGDIWVDKSGGHRVLTSIYHPGRKEWSTLDDTKVLESNLAHLLFRHGVKEF